ncbi:hypothetical protein AB4H10_003148 [Salmonella enterica]|nr:hypothetical protein [Salmonella enterica]EMB3195164.1 hypothetical protein [Salmonella enterica]
MKERGMIFNGEMVRAILDGGKTQTRRIMKVQPEPSKSRPGDFWFSSKKLESMVHVSDLTPGNSPISDCHLFFQELCCPFGTIGDRIWVRETWATLGNEDGCCVDWNDNLCKGDEREAARIYRASCEQRPGDYGLWSIPDNAYWKPHTENEKFEGAWRPSIHMPRWASRILLEITNVRVDRLNSISEQDALSEGIDRERLEESQDNYDCIADHNMTGRPTATGAFKYLWESIYGEENWQVNPWVWVIEFKRVEGGAA